MLEGPGKRRVREIGAYFPGNKDAVTVQGKLCGGLEVQ